MDMQKWLSRRYEILWEQFKENPFSFEDAVKILKYKINDSADQINVILSKLRKNGLIDVKFDPKDARKRIYTLIKSKYKIISETLMFDEKRLTRSDIETLLKKAADLIRTRVDYTFMLVLLFYKRISDKWEFEFNYAYKEALEDDLSEEEARIEAKNSIYHDFDIPEDYLWENIRKDPARLPENFSMAMKSIAERNPELKDVFENVDFIQFTTNRENIEILRQLVELFSAKSLHNVSPDILGDAYEWILRYFAPQKAKEGEVYTPRKVINFLVKILDPKPGESVYDPAVGSAGMLILSYQHLNKEDADKLFLFGQEANYKTIALAKMNLYIHDIRNAQLLFGDTLLNPKFKEGNQLKKFDIVIANPPWNQDGYHEEVLKKGEFWHERFKYGFTTKQSADWVWIQHMLFSADDMKGRVGIVIDNGCLFRGGKEKIIRKSVIEEDLLDAVILLPEKLFYNTGAPGAIMIFSKNKPDERKNQILFINASSEFEKHPEIRRLNILTNKNIENIYKIYKNFEETEGVSRVVSHDEIRENDYNLNVTLYAFPVEEIEEIDINKEWKELKEFENEIDEIENKIEIHLREIE